MMTFNFRKNRYSKFIKRFVRAKTAEYLQKQFLTTGSRNSATGSLKRILNSSSGLKNVIIVTVVTYRTGFT